MNHSFIYSTKEEAFNWYQHIAEFSYFRASIVTGSSICSKNSFLDYFKKEGQCRTGSSTPYVGSYDSQVNGLEISGPSLTGERYYFSWKEVAQATFQRYIARNNLLKYPFSQKYLKREMQDSDSLIVAIHIIQELFCSNYFKNLSLTLKDMQELTPDSMFEKIKSQIAYRNKSTYELLNCSTGSTRSLSLYDKRVLSDEEVPVYRLFSPNDPEYIIGLYSISENGALTIYQGDLTSKDNRLSVQFNNLSNRSYNVIELLEKVRENLIAFYENLTAEDVVLREKYLHQQTLLKKSIERSKQTFLETLSSCSESVVEEHPKEDVLKEDVKPLPVKNIRKRKSTKKVISNLISFKEVQIPKSNLIQISLF